ncbi:MAG: GAF domain-containing sensor histidine kinase [Xanthomonadales bacterium]|nr:GAF domain-containing sensor histidine kinase [Xanthomonadales bacterium]
MEDAEPEVISWDTVASARRLATLVSSGLLDSDPEEAFDRYTRLATSILDVPVSLVSLVTDERQFFKSQIGLEEPWRSCRETPLSHSFCQHVLDGQPLIVTDSRKDERVKGNLAIPELQVAAYAGFPIRGRDGEVYGALCVIDDSPREWSERELSVLADLAEGVSSEIALRERLLDERERKRQLEVTVGRLETIERQMRGQLRVQEETTAMVSHDLRTPLSALLFCAGLLEQDNEPDEHAKIIKRMRIAIEEMDRLVGDLLDVLKLNAGGIGFRVEPVETSRIMERLKSLHQDAAREAGVELAFSGPELLIEVDGKRMVQALSNLVGNAVRATRTGGRVEVSVSEDDAGLHLAVEDTGVGIEPGKLKELFSRFKQGDQPGKAGLGLAIAKGVAEAHGGVLTAESEPGKGSRFEISLPTFSIPRPKEG